MLLRCCGCKLDLPVESFALNRSRQSGRNGICRACKRGRDARKYQLVSEKMRQHNRQWNQDHKESYYWYCREWNARDRAIKWNTGPIDDITLAVLYKRDKAVCQICGEMVEHMQASIDHIKPFHLGGTHTWGNVQLSHVRCNSMKGHRDGNQELSLRTESQGDAR